MINEDKLIETTSEIANMILRLKFGKDYDKCIITNEDNTTEYNEATQDIFNDIYDDIEHLILEDYIHINEIVFNEYIEHKGYKIAEDGTLVEIK